MCFGTSVEDNKKNQKYIADQQKFIKENRIRKGTKLRVIRTAKDYARGWDNIWDEDMKKGFVGKVSHLPLETSGFGIQLSDGYLYPYFVLERA